MSWDTLPSSLQNGIVRQYRVTILDIAGEARVINTTETSVNVVALNPFTMYTCTVAAETIAVGPSTLPVQIVTPQDGKYCSEGQQLYCFSQHIKIVDASYYYISVL